MEGAESVVAADDSVEPLCLVPDVDVVGGLESVCLVASVYYPSGVAEEQPKHSVSFPAESFLPEEEFLPGEEFLLEEEFLLGEGLRDDLLLDLPLDFASGEELDDAVLEGVLHSDYAVLTSMKLNVYLRFHSFQEGTPKGLLLAPLLAPLAGHSSHGGD